MKILNQWPLLFSGLSIILLLSSCEHTVSIGTTVHADGSLDRTVVLAGMDSTEAMENGFGVKAESGWEVAFDPAPASTAESDKKRDVKITFKKHFASVDDANKEMDAGADTLFHIASTFEKRNRWFYTYLEYRDTYRSLNRFTTVPQMDFFTEEDFAFIERLPAEGNRINKADSIYLARLTDKIFELYGARTIFEEQFSHLLASMRENNVSQQWEDSLALKKESIFHRFAVEENEFLSIFASLNIPFPPSVRESVEQKSREIERRANFISTAYSGEYLHAITLPWPVIESNADSVAGNTLFWRPPVIKFLLSDYTMSATARKMNVWAVVVSVLIVGVTVFLFARRPRAIR